MPLSISEEDPAVLHRRPLLDGLSFLKQNPPGAFFPAAFLEDPRNDLLPHHVHEKPAARRHRGVHVPQHRAVVLVVAEVPEGCEQIEGGLERCLPPKPAHVAFDELDVERFVLRPPPCRFDIVARAIDGRDAESTPSQLQ
jgi:hypothetical protein